MTLNAATVVNEDTGVLDQCYLNKMLISCKKYLPLS